MLWNGLHKNDVLDDPKILPQLRGEDGWEARMNENKYYLKINDRIIAERVSLEHALIFIKSIFENYYNDHEIVISIAEMR